MTEPSWKLLWLILLVAILKIEPDRGDTTFRVIFFITWVVLLQIDRTNIKMKSWYEGYATDATGLFPNWPS